VRLSRRALFAGTGALVASAAGVEAASLAGSFDHRAPPDFERKSAQGPALERALSRRDDGIVHIGHSTHLVDVDGLRVLTDPWFSDPAFGALAHTRGPACDVETLVSVDVIAISHEHPDHADLAALDRFSEKTRALVLVPNGALVSKLRELGFPQVTALAAWEHAELRGVRLEAVPALHDVPELGFVIRGRAASVYFAGDTAFHSDFERIRERHRPTVALLPVDGTSLRGSSRPTLDAVEAARAAALLGVRRAIPSHAETRFTDPLAEHLLTAQSPNFGPERFAHELALRVPHCRYQRPAPGERIALG
jgi:L-ascorbate metabolism protein UlaG (beta-lactamase superfamily)